MFLENISGHHEVSGFTMCFFFLAQQLLFTDRLSLNIGIPLSNHISGHRYILLYELVKLHGAAWHCPDLWGYSSYNTWPLDMLAELMRDGT